MKRNVANHLSTWDHLAFGLLVPGFPAAPTPAAYRGNVPLRPSAHCEPLWATGLFRAEAGTVTGTSRHLAAPMRPCCSILNCRKFVPVVLQLPVLLPVDDAVSVKFLSSRVCFRLVSP